VAINLLRSCVAFDGGCVYKEHLWVHDAPGVVDFLEAQEARLGHLDGANTFAGAGRLRGQTRQGSKT
jgi:hypothetical protein